MFLGGVGRRKGLFFVVCGGGGLAGRRSLCLDCWVRGLGVGREGWGLRVREWFGVVGDWWLIYVGMGKGRWRCMQGCWRYLPCGLSCYPTRLD